MRPLSVVIITYNEEKNIGRCIDSVKTIADEVVVLDSFSTDDTLCIAKEKGAVIYQHAFYGYIAQKNKAILLASHDFVLSLDADEALDPELVRSIQKVKEEEQEQAFTMNRCNWYRGRFIRHGLWYPDRKLRLFDRRNGYCGGMNPHDKIELRYTVPVIHLKGDLLHYTYNTVEEYIERNEEVSKTAARSLFDRGIKPNRARIVYSPLWAFFNGYILRLGFLDGSRGWTIACYSARQCYMKYKWLNELYRALPEQSLQSTAERVISTNI